MSVERWALRDECRVLSIGLSVQNRIGNQGRVEVMLESQAGLGVEWSGVGVEWEWEWTGRSGSGVEEHGEGPDGGWSEGGVGG